MLLTKIFILGLECVSQALMRLSVKYSLPQPGIFTQCKNILFWERKKTDKETIEMEKSNCIFMSQH